MVILAVEITNLGPVERAHGRERGAIVAGYGHKRQQMGPVGVFAVFIGEQCVRAGECRKACFSCMNAASSVRLKECRVGQAIIQWPMF
jgi:hypothetical protein